MREKKMEIDIKMVNNKAEDKKVQLIRRCFHAWGDSCQHGAHMFCVC